MDEQARTRADSGAVAQDHELKPLLPDGTKKRILTGDRTTGKLHLGHYVGSLRNRVKYQGVYDTYILMADIQALTTHWESPEILKQSVRDVALDYMAIGLDPYTGGTDDGSKVKIAVQSHIPSIAELTVVYGLVTPMRLLLDNPTTKAEAQQYGMGEERIEEPELFATSTSEGANAFTESSNYTSFILEKFPEIGGVAIRSEVYAAVRTLLKSTDVTAQQELKLHNDPQSEYTPFYQSEYLARAVRDLLIRKKRETGVRQISYGFLGYPVSQAADITFVGGHLVPVGDDQVPHIELTREIVRRFNNQYGDTLVLPQALIGGSTLKGLDGDSKMSKSLGNAVFLSDSDDEIWDKVRKAITDPQRIKKTDPGRPEICNVYAYHEQFNADTEPAIKDADLGVPTLDETAELCKSAGIGCVECKKNLAAKLSAMLNPMRERRSKWENKLDDLMDVLKAGTARGNEEGSKTLARVRQAMHVTYFG